MTDAVFSRPDLDVARILESSLAILSANWRQLSVIAGPVLLAQLLVHSALPDLTHSLNVRGEVQGFVVGYVFASLTVLGPGAFFQAGASWAVFAALDGRSSSAGECAAIAVKCLPQLVSALLLVQIAMVAGTLALVIPRVIISLALAVTTPVMVLEGTGPIASLRRSLDLTRGYRWPFFLLSMLLALFALVVGFLAGLPLGLAHSIVGDPAASYVKDWGSAVVQSVTQTAVVAANAVVTAVAYRRLRSIKGGVGIETQAAVFD